MRAGTLFDERSLDDRLQTVHTVRVLGPDVRGVAVGIEWVEGRSFWRRTRTSRRGVRRRVGCGGDRGSPLPEAGTAPALRM
jgi:hypothetical protein